MNNATISQYAFSLCSDASLSVQNPGRLARRDHLPLHRLAASVY